eukprot:CAMPEP_0201252762 /NCGR_PEP_ID=MMETSP0852-20130820/67090_1 /ASSEMBLY_ACC=CAM_ASM_000632 /TAXON_ID=183588 /ORGANISM="Pseudo-nitzschia fraudulenta, Strain WWA7" /LENGTH=75 /DNA_ID=CAMNT_0047552501 /DNA_START=1394 /DNA_END=1621 /DNA_ORIENTATION=-
MGEKIEVAFGLEITLKAERWKRQRKRSGVQKKAESLKKEGTDDGREGSRKKPDVKRGNSEVVERIAKKYGTLEVS